MIKKFQEFIEEGFLSKTLGRSKSGDVRLGDKEFIDVLCEFSSKVISEYLNKDFDKNICTYKLKETDKYKISYDITFNINDKILTYNCVILKQHRDTITNFGGDFCDALYGFIELEYNKCPKKLKPIFEKLLTKLALEFDIEYYDKVYEGFLSKTLGRTKSGQKRLEDSTDFDIYVNSDEIEWVDMGHPKYLFAKYDYEKPFDVKDIEGIIKRLPKNIKIAGKKEFDYLTQNCKYFTDYLPQTDTFVFKYMSNQKDVVCCKVSKILGTPYFNRVTSHVDDKFVNIRFYEFNRYKIPYTGVTKILYSTSTSKYLSIKLVKEK